MTAVPVEVSTDLRCGACGLTTDLCLASRDDCCSGCTHFLDSTDNDGPDEVAIRRAVAGDVTVALSREEQSSAWRELESLGKSAEEIGVLLGTTGRTVQRWRDGVAHPTARQPGGRRMTTPITAAQGALDGMLLRARQSNDRKVQTAVQRADDALDRLRGALSDAEGRREARARIERLERELREAKAALRGKPTPPQQDKKPRPVGEPAACPKCGKVCANGTGLSAHSRHCAVA